MSNRIPNFGWNRLKLAMFTYEQLAQLEVQVKAEHACKNGIHLFDKAGQRKLDALLGRIQQAEVGACRMTTDITELAQSLKAEDISSERMEWLKKLADMEYCASNPGHWLMNLKETNYLASLALQCLESNSTLVEALEKAQQVDEELCKLLPPGAEYMDPPDGGDVTPLEGVRRMVADYRQRIADLESRTITFKLPFTPEPSAFAPWAAKAFYQFHKDTVKSCVAVFSDACAAAGIKVEAE